DPLPRTDGRPLAGEDQKGRLEGVLGIVMIADDPAADPEDHRAVTTDEGFKGRLVLLIKEGSQQLAIRPAHTLLPQRTPSRTPLCSICYSSSLFANPSLSPLTGTAPLLPLPPVALPEQI